MVGADSVHSGDLMDSEGTYLKDYPEIAEKEYLTTQSGVMQAVDVVVRAGKGSENGGVYLDCQARVPLHYAVDVPAQRPAAEGEVRV